MDKKVTVVPEHIGPSERSGIGKVVPLFYWLDGYSRSDLSRDVMAGMLLPVLLIPQAMAYALLAGLSPQVGLYAAIVPAILYAFSGTSRYLSVGPTAIVSIMVADGIGTVAATTDAAATDVALVLALLVGLTLIVMGTFRFGFLVNFISEPVLKGFTSAAAILIALSQLPNLLALEVDRGQRFFQTIEEIVTEIGQFHGITVAIGLVSLVVLVVGNRTLKTLLKKTNWPRVVRIALGNIAPFAVVTAGTVSVWYFELIPRGVPVVGEISGGLPPLTIPAIRPGMWSALLQSVLAMSLVAYIIAMAVSKSLSVKARKHIDPNQELLGLGIANVGAAFTGGYPVGGSMSRTALNKEAGARSPLASGITAMVVLIAIYSLSSFLRYLPKAVLAAIILNAVVRLVDVRALIRIWSHSRAEVGAMLLTFFTVLFVGVDIGIGVGVAAGVLIYLWRTSKPRVVVQGQVEKSEHYRSVEHDEVEEPSSQVLVMRVDQDLYFGNVEYFQKRVLEEVAERGKIACLLLDLRGVNELDVSALETMERLVNVLREAGIDVSLAEAKQPVLERLERAGFVTDLGTDGVFVSTHEAVTTLRNKYKRIKTKKTTDT